MNREPDLFDVFSAPAAAALPVTGEASFVVHWIHVTPTRARTGCGIYVASYDLKTRFAKTETGERLSCSLDVFSDRVTCQACKDAI